MTLSASPVKHRIGYLDAFRGLAILLVVGYHSFRRWPLLMPYGAEYAEVPLFRFGWLGVPLFFLISGFVILMTLEACDSVGGFLYRRWLRLFPAMLVCSALVWFTAGLFPERPSGAPTLIGLLPGLLFIEPGWLDKILGVPIEPLEGVFWSLYVEFKFYVIAAGLYFWGRKAYLVHCLTGLFLLYVASRFLGHFISGGGGKWLFEACQTLSFEYFGWFAAGASYYLFTKTGDRRHVLAGLGISILNAVCASDWKVPDMVAALLVASLFALVIVSRSLQNLIDGRVLGFFGAISYPLYLIHENMMVAMVVKMGHAWPDLPRSLLPVLPLPALAAVSVLAYGIAHHVERPLKNAIDGVLRRRA